MNKSQNTIFYDDYWRERDGWTPHPLLSSLKRRLFTQLITDSMIVLDVGCGDGTHYGKLLASVAKEYQGLEVSEIAVNIARKNGIQAQLHDLGKTFPFPDSTFDRIICLEVLEHLFSPAFALEEMRRVLKPNGLLLFSVPNIVHFSNRMRVLLGGFSPGGTPETSSQRPWADPHLRFFTLRSIQKFVAEQEFQIVGVYGEGFSIFSTLPFFSTLAARLVGWNRLERWSQTFEFIARMWPSLCAGNLIVVVRQLSD